MTNKTDLENRTLSIKRRIAAPVSLVWDAWTKAEQILQWWAPPGMKATIIRHDFREGGSWEYSIALPDGNAFIAEGVYSKIALHQEIFTSANFRPMTEGIDMQVLFQEKDGETEFVLNCIHPTEEYCKQQEKMGFYNGWGSTIDRLEEMIAGRTTNA